VNQFYMHYRDANLPCLPTIARGIDVEALVGPPHIADEFERFKARVAGRSATEPTGDDGSPSERTGENLR
jgi:hypothetical protein